MDNVNNVFYISSVNAPYLPFNTTLALNMELRVVTLNGDDCRIVAQCRLSHGSFRILTLLAKCREGNRYAELFACLHCPKVVFDDVFHCRVEEQIHFILAPHTDRWQRYLNEISLQGTHGATAFEREMSILRRLVKEEGIHDQFLKHNFEVVVRTKYKYGYMLLSAAQEEKNNGKKLQRNIKTVSQ